MGHNPIPSSPIFQVKTQVEHLEEGISPIGSSGTWRRNMGVPNRVSPQSLLRWSLQAVLCAALRPLPPGHLSLRDGDAGSGLGLSPQLLHVYHV